MERDKPDVDDVTWNFKIHLSFSSVRWITVITIYKWHPESLLPFLGSCTLQMELRQVLNCQNIDLCLQIKFISSCRLKSKGTIYVFMSTVQRPSGTVVLQQYLPECRQAHYWLFQHLYTYILYIRVSSLLVKYHNYISIFCCVPNVSALFVAFAQIWFNLAVINIQPPLHCWQNYQH